MVLKIQYESEDQVQESILMGLHARRIGYFWRCNNVPVYDREGGFYRKLSKYTPRGISDILGVYKGRLIAIEVKSPRALGKFLKYQGTFDPHAEPRKGDIHLYEQCLFLKSINDAGGLGFFTASLNHVLEVLNEI